MSTLVTENLQHPESLTPNITLNADGSVTMSGGTSSIVNTAYQVSNQIISITDLINNNDQFPISDGTEIIRLNYTPISSAGLLRVKTNISYTASTGSVNMIFGLFANSSLIRSVAITSGSGTADIMFLEEFYEFTSNDEIIFSVRAFSISNNTIWINSNTSSSLTFGGTRKSLIIIDEVA